MTRANKRKKRKYIRGRCNRMHVRQLINRFSREIDGVNKDATGPCCWFNYCNGRYIVSG